ncbi:MAG TPA: hypothetical protein VGH74_01960, partial [Planctomycetaceae bacterium]
MVLPAIRRALLLSLLASLIGTGTSLWTTVAQASDWPQFRGPNRNDVSDAKNLLKQWPEGGPPLVWHGDGLGEGYSSMSIVGDRIYSMGDIADSSYITASDRATGKFQWKVLVGKAGG